MSTASAAVYKIQEGRGADCRDALLGNTAKTRVAFVTDRLAIYNALKALTNTAWLISNETSNDLPFNAQIVDGEWRQVMLGYLKKIFELWKDFRERRRSRRGFRRASRRYRDDFVYGLLVAAKKGKHSSSLKTCLHSALLRSAEECWWVFATRDGVEPTNNQAERESAWNCDLTQNQLWVQKRKRRSFC